jgi:hypothetical protein
MPDAAAGTGAVTDFGDNQSDFGVPRLAAHYS